jgi:arabinogalactan oligomer/maltooligosaccharide transport system permease protein
MEDMSTHRNLKTEPIKMKDKTVGISHKQAATWLSVLFMGLGQFYNKQWGKGIMFFAVGCASVYYAVLNAITQIYGLITLGTTPSQKVLVKGVTVFKKGDDSILILINGLIFIGVILILIVLYYINVRDARIDGKERDEGKPLSGFLASLKIVYDKHFPLLILLIPGILLLFWNVIPLLFNFLIAFTNYGVKRPPLEIVDWTLATFKTLVTDRKLFGGVVYVAGWTVFFAFCATASCFLGGTFLAIFIEMKGIRFKTFWRMMIIIPFAIPSLVKLLVMANIFNSQFGPVNMMLNSFGMKSIPWLIDGTWARITVLLVNMWGGFATSMILVTGILATINKDLYEAAEVDGAGIIYKFSKITLPILLVATTPYLILSIASDLNNFNAIYLLTGGGPTNYKYDVGYTDIMSTYLYKIANGTGKYSLGAIISIIMFFLVAGFSLYNFRRSNAYRQEDNN